MPNDNRVEGSAKDIFMGVVEEELSEDLRNETVGSDSTNQTLQSDTGSNNATPYPTSTTPTVQNPQLNHYYYWENWDYNNQLFYNSTAAGVSAMQNYCNYILENYPGQLNEFTQQNELNTEEEGEDMQTVKMRKKRRHRKNVKMSDYDETTRSFAWTTFLQREKERKSIPHVGISEESKKEEEMNEKEFIQMKESTAIATEVATTTTTNSQNHSSINKIVNKIKSQRRKRLRDKLGKQRKQQLKRKERELLEERNLKLDKCLEEKRKLFDLERKSQEVFECAQKSLFEINKKKELVEERLECLASLEKLRHVRTQQIINTTKTNKSKMNYWKQSEFSGKVAKLRNKAKFALEEVQREENMIRLVIKDCQRDSSASKAPTGISRTQHGSNDKHQRDNDHVDNLNKRQRKWNKWLAKKIYCRQELR